jgi:hypothetical protein
MTEFNINLNYWDVHAADKLVRPFSSLYEEDKTKTKKHSSNLMWCLLLLTDPSKANPLSRMNREERLAELSHTLSPDPTLLVDLEEEFAEYKLSYIKKRYRFYQKLLEERERYMGTLSYDTHAQQLDTMLVNTKRIWDEFLKIKKELDVEEQSYYTKGNREESAAEKGLI